MDLLGLRTEVRRRLGESSADFWADAEINIALNEALRRFSMEEKWPWLYTSRTGINLLASQDTLTLEAGVSFPRHFNVMLTASGETRPYFPRRVSAPEGMRLRGLFYQDQPYILYYYVESVAQQAPDSSGVYVYTVRFVPASTRAHTAEYQYIRMPAAMSADTNEPDVPEEYQSALVAWATAQLWLKELNGDRKAQEQFQLYNKVLDDARRELRRQSPDEVVAWGKSEPELGGIDERTAAYMRIPPTLGP